eukprot:43566_1
MNSKMEPRPIPTLTLPNVVNWTPPTSTSNSIETSRSYITPQSTYSLSFTPSSSLSVPRSVSRGVPVSVSTMYTPPPVSSDLTNHWNSRSTPFCNNRYLNMGLTTSDHMHTRSWPDTAITMTNIMTSPDPVSTTTSSMLAPPFIPQEKGKGRGDHDETTSTFDQEPLEA